MVGFLIVYLNVQAHTEQVEYIQIEFLPFIILASVMRIHLIRIGVYFFIHGAFDKKKKFIYLALIFGSCHLCAFILRLLIRCTHIRMQFFNNKISLHRNNDFARISKTLTIDVYTDLKIILLDYQNNYVKNLALFQSFVAPECRASRHFFLFKQSESIFS